MSKYKWASNPQKLARAIGIVGDRPNISKEKVEAEVKEEYIKIGGLLNPMEITVKNDDGTEQKFVPEVVDVPVNVEEVVEAPKEESKPEVVPEIVEESPEEIPKVDASQPGDGSGVSESSVNKSVESVESSKDDAQI